MPYANYLANKQAFQRLQSGREKDALARRAGGMMAGGDVAGARNALYQGGQLDAGLKLDEHLGVQKKAKAEAAERWAQGLDKMMKDPRFASNPEAAYQMAMPFAERLGLSPQEVEADRQLFVRDPQGYATMLMEQARREKLEFAKGSDGSYSAIDPYTGQRVGGYTPAEPDKYEQWDPDKEVRRIPGRPESTFGAAGGAPLVAPSGPEPTPAWRQPGYQGTPPFVPDQRGPVRPEAPVYREAIASIESRGSGDYGALGPTTRKGDRAYGRYQVMGANIPTWTEEVLGQRMTPQQFLASPEAQDAVFDAKFGGYVEQYGSPEEAASVWFTGRPQAQGANRRDVNGMTGSRYVQKFSQAMGGAPLQGGSGGDPIAAGAPELVRPARPVAAKGWTRDPQNPGFLINSNGDVKPDPRVQKPRAGGGGLSPKDQKTLADLRTAAQNIRSARAQAEEFNKINRQSGTGGLMAVPGVSEMVGAFDPKVSAMQGLSNAMIPGMHITPGPMTDADAKLYKSAIPNPNLPGSANRVLSRDIARKEEEAAARLAYFETWARRFNTLNGADAAFNRFWTKYKSKPAGGRGGDGPAPFSDPGKEARYQQWLKRNGGR
jgi:hypothetical protein